jgi:tRNA (adenine22-N1)-methyltransferase
MELSERLKMVADMVEPCDLAADIGTDHAYLPIYLYKKGIIKRAVAADISRGSCDKATKNIRAHRLEEYIEVRCGNGLAVFSEEECPDTIVIAGMGGMLAIDVLKSHTCGSNAKRLVLQVQRDIYAVRKYLHTIGYKIIAENMLREGGKYYTAMAAVKGEDKKYGEVDYHFGKILLENGNKSLKEYIEFEYNKINKVLLSLEDKSGAEIEERKRELEAMASIQREALKCL